MCTPWRRPVYRFPCVYRGRVYDHAGPKYVVAALVSGMFSTFIVLSLISPYGLI